MAWILRRLETTGGYLRDCPIDFSPGLNCIIGARGTCKSTVVETVRFVFNSGDPDVIKALLHSSSGLLSAGGARSGLITATLGGATARCGLSESGPSERREFVVERAGGSPPRVLLDEVQQVDASGHLEQIEIFSQGDLQGLAENPGRRLALIDRPNQARVLQLLDRQEDIVRQLKAVGDSLSKRRPEIDSREANIRGLAAARAQLAALTNSRPEISAELESQKQLHESRQAALRQVEAAVKARYNLVLALKQSIGDVYLDAAEAAFAANMGHAPGRLIAEHLQEVLAIRAQVEQLVAQPSALEAALREIQAVNDTQSLPFRQALREQQELNAALRQEEALRQAIHDMELIERDLADRRLENDRDLKLRSQLRGERDRIRNELYEMRLAEVDAINARYSKAIVLTLSTGLLTQQHVDTIRGLLLKSNLRNQEEVARDLAEKIEPSDLIDIVEGADARRLSEALQRDVGQMTRLLSHLLDNPDLYRLETIVPEDCLEITMVVKGEAKPLGQLSKGQMATALLPLILRDADYPLIVDQPEDDLDNAFIFETLIEKIRELSATRQLIFVTHNANIPVLGEASNVVVMEMDGPRLARPCKTGDVDQVKGEIIALLEGGKDAFLKRHKRYESVLNSNG